MFLFGNFRIFTVTCKLATAAEYTEFQKLQGGRASLPHS